MIYSDEYAWMIQVHFKDSRYP